MTMTIDANQHRFGPLTFEPMSSYQSHPQFTNPWVPSSATSAPQSGSQALFVGSQDGTTLPHLNLSSLNKPAHPHAPHPQAHPQHSSRTTSAAPPNGAPLASFGPLPNSHGLPVTAASAGSTLASTADVYGQQNLLTASQDLLSLGSRMQPHPTSSAAYDTTAYTTATASPVSATYATSPTPYDQLGYGAPAPIRSTSTAAFALHPDHHHQDSSRRYSQQSVASIASSGMSGSTTGSGFGSGAEESPLPPHAQPRSTSDHYDYSLHQDDRKRFQDALEASQGMLSMSQETPRNIFDVRSQQARALPHVGSTDGYGFPSAPNRHSTSSSVSSTGFSSGYYGSMDGSVSDYSTAGSDIESLSGRNVNGMPRHHGQPSLVPSQPPPASTMMSQFSSKIASSTQKKHKCKVCDKRFTRPSSLQTHMYSHTGEKPFCCEVEGCGRHFSVVSNLRRHKKVHRNNQDKEAQTPSDAGSEDHQSE